MVRGTDENKNKLKEYIQEIKAQGSTCGQCGIQRAFEIFRQSQNSDAGGAQNSAGCERIISFLTDGKMNDNEWDQWKDWMDDQKTALGNPSPHIFTYALGNGADETIPAQLACENDGWFAKVEDGDPAALKHAMIRYFEYFSDKIPLGNASSTPRWSEFYMDSSGQGKMTTVAVPVYANDAKTNKRVFHGVVGIDVLAADFGASLDDSVLAVRLQQRSSQCVKYDFTQQGDTSGKVISPKASEKYCQITPIKSEAPYIPTGATIEQVYEDHCKENSDGLILAIILPILFCCCCVVGVMAFRRRAKGRHVHDRNKPIGVQAATNVQMVPQNHPNMQRGSFSMQPHAQQGMMQQQGIMVQPQIMQHPVGAQPVPIVQATHLTQNNNQRNI